MNKIIIGAKPFNEQKILVNIISKLLEIKGIESEVKVSEPVLEANYNSIKSGEIDFYIEYSGTIYNALFNLEEMKNWDNDLVLERVSKRLEKDNMMLLTDLDYESGFVITSKIKIDDINTISELSKNSEKYIFSCPKPYITRKDGLPALNRAYKLKFKDIVPYQPDEMYKALLNEEVDFITGFTTDSRVIEHELFLIEDDKNALPPYEAIIIAKKGLDDSVQEVLKDLKGKISNEIIRKLNYMFDFENKSTEEIANYYIKNMVD
ncbi:glycine betaine ABC transporter substrate-binding protein [Geotoga petraea]|uniref:Osmoprotectant transport system substrate-binding protein n=1 Tax=Geotoga petraea TaxID=28234 RepID=A0A1G6KA20_9BACT|nr:glycine betaine ABC transporter substrate-binding protein [Geotoga petraea]MDK2945992.1 osmoprotectant transport system substrate-binding protein [Geotoga sp.]TGG88472.1 osmoprotection protein (proX) [Geotoga petraea]SDC27718.1 osmoprotectant transport system substrate-binding protein [Geotoga petraea]